MSTLTGKPFTDDELLDKLLFCRLEYGEQAFICDLCGAFAKYRCLLRHKPWCPEAGGRHGD